MSFGCHRFVQKPTNLLRISALASKNSIFLCSHFKNDSCFKVSILKIVNFFRQNSKRQFSKIRTNCSFLREVVAV